MEKDDERGPGLAEAPVVWTLFGVAALMVLVTYARLPPAELYNVDEDGLAGGAGRALVFLGYPTALAAVAVLGLVADRPASPAERGVTFAAALLCASVVWPGVVEQSDLDAKPVNALAGVGVLLALGLMVVALVRGGLGRSAPLGPWDAVRAALAVVLLLAAVPWLAADLGFSADDAPGLGFLMGGEPRPEPGHPDLIAVHLGHHHGLDGTLLALTALLLSRAVPLVRGSRLRLALGFYVALMLVYGLANALEDFWLEQLVKRGTTDARLPGMIRPDASPEWGALLAAALLIQSAALTVRRLRNRTDREELHDTTRSRAPARRPCRRARRGRVRRRRRRRGGRAGRDRRRRGRRHHAGARRRPGRRPRVRHE
ncbi:MAG: hypothetical protein ACRDON_11550 [Gaiellaceae bacterium]